jgi:hypothetical protein
MKKLALLLSVFVASTAWAGPCELALGSNFTANQEVALCKAFGTLGVTGNTANTNYESVAGAGTTAANAAALSATKYVHRITGANGTVGWRLPTVTAANLNQVHFLLNTTAGVANVYAQVGGTVNGGAVDAAFVALTGIKPIMCVATAAATWVCS